MKQCTLFCRQCDSYYYAEGPGLSSWHQITRTKSVSIILFLSRKVDPTSRKGRLQLVVATNFQKYTQLRIAENSQNFRNSLINFIKIKLLDNDMTGSQLIQFIILYILLLRIRFVCII